VVLQNGDDVHFEDLLSFKNDTYALRLDTVKDFQLSRFRCTETGGVNSTQYAVLIDTCERVNLISSQISQLVASNRPSGRLCSIVSSSQVNVSNFEWSGANGTAIDTSLGLSITGTSSDLNFVNGRISNIIDIDTGDGIFLGDNTNPISRCKFVNVHTQTTGGRGIKQNNNVELELVNCTTDEPMVGSVAATRAGWDLRSNGKTKVIGGQVTGSNITAGHGVHCGSDDEIKLIGVTAGDGITATGDIRVFVEDCDTLGNGNLAQTITATINTGAITAGATYSTSLTLTGAKLGDCILYGVGTTTFGALQITVRIGTTDTVDIEIHNPTGGTITPSSSTWYFKLKKLA